MNCGNIRRYGVPLSLSTGILYHMYRNSPQIADQPFGVVESVKAVSDLYSPVSGKVSEINDAIVDSPEAINEDPYGDAWMIKVELGDAGELGELMSAEDYRQFVEEEK